jgi:K(+)-stimulated pyrophosphate-energized sodium pump
MAIAGFDLFSIIGTLLVKITDDNAKRGTSSKALNIGIGCLLDLQQSLVIS